MTITTIRHGQTDWNLERKLQGRTDVPLNATGIDQAIRLGKRLAGEPCDIIYTSDLQRAKVTAEHINAHHQVPLIVEPGLREAGLAEFEGQSLHDPQVVTAFDQYMNEASPAHFEQVKRDLQKILDCGKEHVFIVAHYMTIRAIICALLGLPIEERGQFTIGNTAIHVFKQRSDGTFGIVLENDTDHLDD